MCLKYVSGITLKICRLLQHKKETAAVVLKLYRCQGRHLASSPSNDCHMLTSWYLKLTSRCPWKRELLVHQGSSQTVTRHPCLTSPSFWPPASTLMNRGQHHGCRAMANIRYIIHGIHWESADTSDPGSVSHEGVNILCWLNRNVNDITFNLIFSTKDFFVTSNII